MRNRIGLFVVLAILLMTSCKSDYDKLVRTEMKSGLIKEDLIFGLKFLGNVFVEVLCYVFSKQLQDKVKVVQHYINFLHDTFFFFFKIFDVQY